MYRMQPTTNEESLKTAIPSRAQPRTMAQPTREQEEYAMGFKAALDRIYAQRGFPIAVRARLQSTPSDCDQTAPSNSTPQLSAARSRQSSLSTSESSVACFTVSSQSLPAAVKNVTMSADSQSASTTIPLCVARLQESNISDDHLLGDKSHHQQPTAATGTSIIVC